MREESAMQAPHILLLAFQMNKVPCWNAFTDRRVIIPTILCVVIGEAGVIPSQRDRVEISCGCRVNLDLYRYAQRCRVCCMLVTV